jgi:choline dehydrogenase-like flavoprotein
MADGQFDYVIVGGGTAGCALAGRLSEDPRSRICLLEAGGKDSHPFIKIPAGVAAAIGTEKLNWRFATVPQPALNGRRVPVPRGRVLGGSGSINGMVYFRGHPRDFDDWAAAGATGWSYAEVLPYFTRSENNEDHPASVYHGSGGPMNVRTPGRPPNALNHAFISACESLQFRRNPDFNGADPEGVGLRQGVIRDGTRETTARAFLRPALKRGNVQVVTGAYAQRILLDGRRATGIEYQVGGEVRQVSAAREVILTAGAVQTPQLMLLSGIGPGADLQALGLPVAHDLPGVGRNYHDHLACPVFMETDQHTSYGISLRALPRGMWNVLEYLIFRRGPLASNVFESVGFLKTLPELERPDIQFVFQPARRPRPSFPLPIGHGYAISPVSLYPKSRGTLTLASPDPATPPNIDPALLAVPSDIDPLVRAIRLSRRILAAPAFAPYRGHEVSPGPEVQSDAQIEAHIRAAAYTVHHPVGSCRMGGGGQAVVDPELRVIGIDGLRIADASVFPSIVGGNTNAGVVMVAEKASDMIRGRPALPPAELDEDSVVRRAA